MYLGGRHGSRQQLASASNNNTNGIKTQASLGFQTENANDGLASSYLSASLWFSANLHAIRYCKPPRIPVALLIAQTSPISGPGLVPACQLLHSGENRWAIVPDLSAPRNARKTSDFRSQTPFVPARKPSIRIAKKRCRERCVASRQLGMVFPESRSCGRRTPILLQGWCGRGGILLPG